MKNILFFIILSIIFVISLSLSSYLYGEEATHMSSQAIIIALLIMLLKQK